MVVEALSFKLVLDLFQYFKKNRIYASNIKLRFWNRNNSEFITFNNVDELFSYFITQYQTVDDCILGSLCSVEVFNATSDIYNFTTEYIATNIIESYNLTTSSQYDRQRNNQRKPLINRQINFINQSVKEYTEHYNELNRIYINGIYSPCYAIPGWSEGTGYLKTLKNLLFNNASKNNNSNKINQKNCVSKD